MFDSLEVEAAELPIDDIRDSLTREAHDHEAFAETRRRSYLGRPDSFASLDCHAAGDGAPLVVRGDPGSGKSALLANWLEHWREGNPHDFILPHYIGGSTGGVSHWKLIARLVVEIKRWSGDSVDAPRSNEDLLRDFPLWLAKARLKAEQRGVRFIILLDGLNELEGNEQARLVGWLPSHAFTGALRLIVSTTPGDTLEALQKRGWGALRVEPLSPDERRRMIAEYLERHGTRSLDVPRWNRLAVAPASANPLYLKIVLDELRVTGTHERLDGLFDDCLAAEGIPGLLKQMLERYRRDYERDRPGVVGEALGLIWAARRGLSETELLRLLKPPASWLPLRAALEGWLVDRGGILTFAHEVFRAAVESSFAPDEDTRDELRLRLADDFEQQPISARSCDELPWLLLQTESYQRLRERLLDVDRFLEINKRDEEELRRYWVDLGEERAMGGLYLESFKQWSKQPHRAEDQICRAANELSLFLGHSALYAEAESLIRSVLDIDTKNLGLNHYIIGTRCSHLARLLESMNRVDEAEGLYRLALSISEQNFGLEHPKTAACLVDLSNLLQKANRLDEAEMLVRRALVTDEKCLGPDHANVANRLNILAGLLQRTNRLAQAESLMRRSLAIMESHFGLFHPNVAARLGDLALMLYEANRLAEAEPLVRRVLTTDEQTYGPEHPAVARDLNNLAGVLERMNRLAEAEPLYRRAQVMFEKNLGANHPDVGTSLNNLGQVLKKMGRLVEAEPILLRAVQIFHGSTRVRQQLDPRLQMAVNNYGRLLESMGRSVEQIDVAVREIAPELYDSTHSCRG